MKSKKDITITNAFQKLLHEFNRKAKKLKQNKIKKNGKIILVNNRSMKPWSRENDIEMYSTHNEGKSVVAEKIIRTLKNKI